MAGVLYAHFEHNYKDALENFDKAARSIKSSQKALGTSFHENTAAAIRNNIAVCSLKSGSDEKGASLLARKTKGLDAIPFYTHHNATLALEVCDEPRHRVKLGTASREKLEGVLMIKPRANLGAPAPRFFLYSLDWNSPLTLDQILKLEQGKPLAANGPNLLFPNRWCRNDWLPDAWCPHCEGTDWLDCTNRQCKGGKVAGKKPVLRGRHPNGQEVWGADPVFDVCPVCKGKNKIRCPWSLNGKIPERRKP